MKGKRLNIDGIDSNRLGINQLLIMANEAFPEICEKDFFKTVSKGQNIDILTFLTREGEKFSAWRDPLNHGQSSNIDEFFRVLYKAEIGDEAGGFLLSLEGRGAKKGFRVFPGQLLLKTVTFLAMQNKNASKGNRGGILVLQDVIDHFSQYGIDFSTAADARPLLMNELQSMGLLKGSPDAGSSVSVTCPYC